MDQVHFFQLPKMDRTRSTFFQLGPVFSEKSGPPPSPLFSEKNGPGVHFFPGPLFAWQAKCFNPKLQEQYQICKATPKSWNHTPYILMIEVALPIQLLAS